jgi:tRNA nucleotidyltransferase (CCA-adding enzyme)
MARPGASYPQVEPGAAGLMTAPLARCAATAPVSRAIAASRRARASIVLVGPRAAARAHDLERASAWGLGRSAVASLAWPDLPVMESSAPEIAVRRALAAGAPIVLVRSGRRVVGAVDAAAHAMARSALSVAPQLEHAPDAHAEARLWLLRRAGKVGEAAGLPVYAVGGVVRDLLRGAAPLDVDLVVEGDGAELARRLGAEIGGRVVKHASFGTASIAGGRTPDGTPLGRIDVATARRERYPRPGALPVVSPAPLAADLARRDFSVNALAVALVPSVFGRLIDVPGAERDLRARRLRPLHPLSFVEDPTRIFRAARYAARLGFAMDPAGMRALRLARETGAIPALSGQRLHAELELIARERTGWEALGLLHRWQAFRIWDRGYRSTAAGGKRIGDARRLARWAEAVHVAFDTVELMRLAVLLDQPAPVVTRALGRLAVTGEAASRLVAAQRRASVIVRRLTARPSPPPSAVDAVLRPCPPVAIAAAWLLGGRGARRRIEWFLREGRTARPALAGDDVIALGVVPGPAVGRCLAELRRRRLDGAISTRAQEEAFVTKWTAAEKGDPR